MVKSTQISHTDNVPKQVDQVAQVEILAPVEIKVLEYDTQDRPCKSQRRPRRDALPRCWTPPKPQRTLYHLLPFRICLTNSDKSELAPSEFAEKQEDLEMFKRKEEKFMAY